MSRHKLLGVRASTAGYALKCLLLLTAFPVEGSAASPEDPRLERLRDNLRAAEALYDVCEIDSAIVCNIQPLPTAPAGERFSQVRETFHRVVQGGMFRYEYTDSAQLEEREKAPILTHALTGFDGNQTKVRVGGVGNIIDARREDSGPGVVLRPHTMLMYRYQLQAPLSNFLATTDTPALGSSGFYKSTRLTCSYVGREVVGGLECEVLTVLQSPTVEKTPSQDAVTKIWLAVERNYLPVRFEETPARTNGRSSIIGAASDFRELAPGVWLPFRGDVQVFDEYLLSQGDVRQSCIEELTVQRATLEVNYPQSYFSDVTFPEGSVVYTVKAGKIVKTEKIGVPEIPRREEVAEQRFTFLWVVVGVAVLVGLAVLVARFVPDRRSSPSASKATP